MITFLLILGCSLLVIASVYSLIVHRTMSRMKTENQLFHELSNIDDYGDFFYRLINYFNLHKIRRKRTPVWLLRRLLGKIERLQINNLKNLKLNSRTLNAMDSYCSSIEIIDPSERMWFREIINESFDENSDRVAEIYVRAILFERQDCHENLIKYLNRYINTRKCIIREKILELLKEAKESAAPEKKELIEAEIVKFTARFLPLKKEAE